MGTASAGLGLQYVLRGLLSAFISMIADAADMIGDGVVTLLQPNIGSGTSIFDIMFSSFGDLLSLFQIMATTLLFLNFIWQIFKIMLTPQGSESPLGLVAGTVFAGIFIYWSTRVIVVAEHIAATFYSYILNLGEETTGLTLFSGFVKDFAVGMGTATPDSFTDRLGDLTSPLANGSLGQLLIILLLVIWLAYQFFLYIIEVVERYVLLGVLYYTSPLAFSFAGSKSTRNVFWSWVKMVLSQLFLMICNVFFFKMFIYGFSRFNETMEAMSVGGERASTGMMIVWALILFGILYVGQRIDSYLSTLGLNVAQTGRGMGAALVASALGAGRFLQSARNLGATAYNSKLGQVGKDAVTNTAKKWAWENNLSGKAVPKGASMSPDAVIANAGKSGVFRKSDYGNINPRSIADGFGSAVQTGKGQNRTAANILSQTDKNSYRFNPDGTYSAGIQNGQGRAIATIHKNDGSLDNAQGQHFTTKDGSKFVMTFAPADNSAASRSLATNLSNQDIGLEEAVMKKYGDSHIISKSDSGIYNVEKRDPKTNEIQEARQIAPASGFANDATGGARHRFTAGQYQSDGDVCEVDYTAYARAKEATGYASFTEPKYGAASAADQARCLKENFASFNQGNAQLENVQLWCNGQDIHTFAARADDGTIHSYAMANALEYAVNKDVVPAGICETRRANNGMDYAVVDLGVSTGNGPVPNPNAVFVQNGTPGYGAVQGGVSSHGAAAQVNGVSSNGTAPAFFSRTAPISNEDLHANVSNNIHQASQERTNSKKKNR